MDRRLSPETSHYPKRSSPLLAGLYGDLPGERYGGRAHTVINEIRRSFGLGTIVSERVPEDFVVSASGRVTEQSVEREAVGLFAGMLVAAQMESCDVKR